MRRTMFGCVVLGLAASCFGQALCPRHIETPVYYPRIARAARLQGKVNLRVMIDADGNVKNVQVENSHEIAQVLQEAAIENVRRWTFERPAATSVTQAIIYEFKFDSSLPVSRENYPITKVTIDLPDRVTILSNELVMNPDQSKKKNQVSKLP